MKKIFIDTSALVALINQEDNSHYKSVAIFTECHDSNVVLVTTDYVISEFFTIMRCTFKKPVKQLVSFINGILVSEIQLFGITEDVFSEALRVLVSYDDQYFSFTDCVSFIAMNELKTKDVLTTDKHFSVVGFNNLLK